MDIDKILDYENLVYSVIHKFHDYEHFDDLYQVGMLGLMKAFRNYNDDGGAKFSTYAYFYIMGEVNDYFRKNKSVRVSRDTMKLYQSIEKGRDVLRQKLSREPTDYEVSVFLEIDLSTISMVSNAMLSVKSLDDVYAFDSEREYYNSVKVYDQKMDESFLDLEDAIRSLSLEEQKIIYDRYFNGYTQSEISDSLGISQVQVSRKESKILKKLKVHL